MREYLGDLWAQLATRWDTIRRQTALWLPASTGPVWAAPLVALGALLALAVLAGLSILSLGVLLTSLIAAHLVLERVLGISIELEPVR